MSVPPLAGPEAGLLLVTENGSGPCVVGGGCGVWVAGGDCVGTLAGGDCAGGVVDGDGDCPAVAGVRCNVTSKVFTPVKKLISWFAIPVNVEKNEMTAPSTPS